MGIREPWAAVSREVKLDKIVSAHPRGLGQQSSRTLKRRHSVGPFAGPGNWAEPPVSSRGLIRWLRAAVGGDRLTSRRPRSGSGGGIRSMSLLFPSIQSPPPDVPTLPH